MDNMIKITGNAKDASDISSVKIKIEDNTDEENKLYWDGSQWVSEVTELDATLDGISTQTIDHIFYYEFSKDNLTYGNNYTVYAKATDIYDHQSEYISESFIYQVLPPVSTPVLKDYYNAAINAIRLARNHPTYIKIADNCASYLYHEQGRYSTAAEIYLDIADYYKDIGMTDKYEKNMNYAASSYIQAADKILNYSVKGDSDEEIIRYYLQNAFNIYTELNRQDLAKMVETRLKELGTPTRGE